MARQDNYVEAFSHSAFSRHSAWRVIAVGDSPLSATTERFCILPCHISCLALPCLAIFVFRDFCPTASFVVLPSCLVFSCLVLPCLHLLSCLILSLDLACGLGGSYSVGAVLAFIVSALVLYVRNKALTVTLTVTLTLTLTLASTLPSKLMEPFMLKNGEMKFDTYHPFLSLGCLSPGLTLFALGCGSLCLSLSLCLGLASSSWSWSFLAVALAFCIDPLFLTLVGRGVSDDRVAHDKKRMSTGYPSPVLNTWYCFCDSKVLVFVLDMFSWSFL